MLLSISLILILGMFMGWICQKIKLPALLGMLITGVILGPYGLNLLDGSILGISARIKCPYQFIYIMLKFPVLKQNTNLKQMDYTSFRNRLWWMHHAPDIPLCHPEVHQEACADFLQLLLYFLPENLFCPLSRKKQCHR